MRRFAWLAFVMVAACSEESTPPIASFDAGSYDAHEIDLDGRVCADATSAPIAPHLTAMCVNGTLQCLMGCDPGPGYDTCYDRCIDMDPMAMGCRRCIQTNAAYCYTTRGCREAWALLDCCAAWPGCLGRADTETCAADECPEEWSYLARCVSPLQREYVCDDLVQTCFDPL